MTICLFETLAAFTVSCLLSAMIIPRISLVAFKRRLFDPQNDRKLHTTPIPRLGGTAFFPCIAVPISLIIACHNLCTDSNLLCWEQSTCLLTLFSCLFILYLAGMKDDLIGMRYRAKFVIQILCGVMLIAGGVYINNLYGVLGIHAVPLWLGYPLTILIVVFIINAINLIDGIDGLASGLCSIACLFYGLTFFMLHQYVYAMLAFATLGVLVPFFYYNVFGNAKHGRKIFMGDTGSLTIGMMLCFLSLKLTMCGLDDNTGNVHPMVLAFSPLLVPCCDVVRVYLHRVRNGKNPFLPDKNHIHHKLLALGIKQRNTMIIIVSVSTIFILLNILLSLYLNVNWIVLGDILIWTLANIRLTKSIAQLQSEQKTNK